MYWGTSLDHSAKILVMVHLDFFPLSHFCSSHQGTKSRSLLKLTASTANQGGNFSRGALLSVIMKHMCVQNHFLIDCLLTPHLELNPLKMCQVCSDQRYVTLRYVTRRISM